MKHAAPLQPADRRPFVEAVTQALEGVEPGPGAIQRACAAAQRVFVDRATGGRMQAASEMANEVGACEKPNALGFRLSCLADHPRPPATYHYFSRKECFGVQLASPSALLYTSTRLI